MSNKLKIHLFILSFIEGGAVMCVELCSAKILNPVFGTSIYVWAAVLGITLAALMSGYYFGGYISSKNNKLSTVLWLMLTGGLLVSFTPSISDFILPITINFSIISGSIVSLFFILFIPLACFGATSPLLIKHLTSDAKESGKSSGTVYAISTLGGIITTFLLGFYTLPEFGITKTLYSYGILIMVFTVYLFVLIKTKKLTPAIVLIVGLLSLNFQNHHSKEIIYFSEGILGELKVADRVLQDPTTNETKIYRQLIVNNTSQTIMDLDNPDESYWDYVGVLTYNLSSYTNKKKVLLLGLGGGTLYKALKKQGYSIDVVEIDERIADVAKEFFFIEKDLNVIVDDARHYLNTTSEKYDIIIYDLFQAETPPIHIMTTEAFVDLKRNLNPDGMLVVNFYGFINNSIGKASRSIYKTLQHSGYNISLLGTSEIENQRNLLFFCSEKELKASNQIIHPMIYEMDIDLNDAEVLTDEKPKLEHLHAEAAISWRTQYNEYNTKYYFNQK